MNSTLNLILTVLSIVLTILQSDTIKDRFRRWNKSTLENLLRDIEAPDYIQRHRYLRDRNALIGFALMAGSITLATFTFTAMYPVINRPIVAVTVLLQMFGGYLAFICFASAILENKCATEAYVQARLKKLSKRYEKFRALKLQP